MHVFILRVILIALKNVETKLSGIKLVPKPMFVSSFQKSLEHAHWHNKKIILIMQFKQNQDLIVLVSNIITIRRIDLTKCIEGLKARVSMI